MTSRNKNSFSRKSPFPTWLRSRLAVMDMTTEHFAHRCDVSRVTVSHWINGRSLPCVEKWDVVASVVSLVLSVDKSSVLIEMSGTLNTKTIN